MTVAVIRPARWCVSLPEEFEQLKTLTKAGKIAARERA